jgi:hypothetical protein
MRPPGTHRLQGGARRSTLAPARRLDGAIRERGHRRWYERQLIDGHLWLVTGFLALIMMLIAIEVVPFRSSAGALVLLTAISLAGSGVCLVAWRRFTRTLFCAEHWGAQAVYPGCGTYARFVVDHGPEAPESITGWRLDLRCRQCDHR